MISRAATTAWCIETGLAFTFHRLSSACESASRPVLIVSWRGFPVISAGSTSACLG